MRPYAVKVCLYIYACKKSTCIPSKKLAATEMAAALAYVKRA